MDKEDLASEKSSEEPEKFEPLLARLEKTVRQLEDGNLSLDESLKQYLEAVELYRRCRKVLDGAQKKVEILLEDTKGELKASAFEVDAAGDESP